MDEQHPAARVVDPSTFVRTAAPLPREPFDPAVLLDGRRPPPLPYATGPTVAVVREFDPAAFLGERALRGAFNLATVKPLVTTLGGVEMVTVPATAYADALRRIAAQELPAEAVEQAGPVPDAVGMLDLLLALHAAGAVSADQLARATGLDPVDLGERITARAAEQPQPWPVELDQDGVIRGTTPEGQRFRLEPLPEPGEVSEAHGAALDSGRETEAQGAAIDAGKPKRHPRRADPVREIP